MEYIAQPTRTSCGIACVAMLAGVSFEDAKKVIGKRGLTTTKDVSRGLEKLGINCPSRLVRIKAMPKTEPLPMPCLVKIKPFDRSISRWHWVVADNGRVYDPDNTEQLDLVYEWGKPTSYLPIG